MSALATLIVMHGRLMGPRRIGFVLALLASAAVFAYSLTGIVRAGDDLRAKAEPRSSERQTPVYDCPERRHESVRL